MSESMNLQEVIAEIKQELDANRMVDNCLARRLLLAYENAKAELDHAWDCVDKVFQAGIKGQEPILPGFITLGENKFDAVIKLAECHNSIVDDLAAANERAEKAEAEVKRLQTELEDAQEEIGCLSGENSEIDSFLERAVCELEKLNPEHECVKSFFDGETMRGSEYGYYGSMKAENARLREALEDIVARIKIAILKQCKPNMLNTDKQEAALTGGEREQS